MSYHLAKIVTFPKDKGLFLIFNSRFRPTLEMTYNFTNSEWLSKLQRSTKNDYNAFGCDGYRFSIVVHCNAWEIMP